MRGTGLQSLEQVKIEAEGDIKESIYKVLKKMIMTRECTPNERLDAYEIAKRLGVSRTPVRDALNMLDSEGFIRTIGRKGTFVTGIYKQDLIELFEHREMIELYTLDKGFQTLAGSVGQLSDVMEQWDRETEKQDYEGSVILDIDVQIHRLIVRTAGNDRIYRAYEALNCHVHMARSYYMEEPRRIAAAQSEHRAVLEAVKQGDLPESKRLLKLHLDNTLESLLRLIDIFKVF